MAKTPVVKITFVGDSTSAQKSVKDLAATTGQAEISVAGFGKEFLKLGLAVGAVALLKQAGDGIADYSQKVQTAETSIAALTKSQAAVTRAQALANRELEAGRAAYSDTLVALDALTPVSLRTGVAIEDLYKTSQLLATLNSGPGGGVEGAIVAISEALSGDWTSAIERFNLPRAEINRLKAEGVPALEILNRTLAQSGVTMETVGAKAKTAAVQQKILLDTLAKIGAESGGKQGLDLFTTALIALNKELQSPAVKEFAVGLRELIELASAGALMQDFGLQTAKAFFLVGDAFNNMIKAISGGKLNVDGPLAAFRAQIVADEGKLRTTVQEKIGKPVADELSGKGSGSPLAPAKVQGYGRAVLENFLQGASEADVDKLLDLSKLFPDAIKKDTPEFADALSTVAQAMREVAQSGQVGETTLFRLNSIFGKQTDSIAAQIVAYGNLTSATARHTAATQAEADAEANLQQVRNRATGDLATYQGAIDAATQAATDNAAAASEAVEGLQDTLEGVRDAAESSARAGADQIAGLQSDLDAIQGQADRNRDAAQAQIAEAQAALDAAHEKRQQHQELLQAALEGELEERIRILGVTDREVLAVAAKWDAEIAGARRAKEGADSEVAKLRRAANKENLDYLERIDAARKSGNEKEARRLERELAARQKGRQAETALAQARAAVADDEYDTQAERLKKEADKLDEKDQQAEQAAQAELTRIQTGAKAQADADQTAIKAKQDQIKGVQAAQKAEAERYAAQQRGIQAEIARVQDAAKEQKKKDDAAIKAAQDLYAQRQTFWNVETAGAQAAVNLTGGMATGWERIAKAAQDWLDKIEKAAQVLKDNPAVVAPQPGSRPPTQTSPYDETTPYVPPTSAAAPPPAAPRPKPPLIDGTGKSVIPDGYHAESEPSTQTVWFVPDGYTLADYGKKGTGAPPPSTGGPGGLSRVGGGEFAAGSPSFSRTSLGGGEQSGDGGTTIIINAPNLRDVRDRRDLDDLGAHMERAWKDIKRGGRVKREVGS